MLCNHKHLHCSGRYKTLVGKMTKHIELTNTSNPTMLGSKFLINTDDITTVYERPMVEGGSLVTAIYCAKNNSEWTVEEGYSEVKKLIQGAK